MSRYLYRQCTKTCLIDTDTRYCSETLNRYRYRYESIARYVSPMQVSRYCPSLGISKGVTNFSALQGEFLMMILLIPSLKTSTGDQQIIDVVIRENACFSVRAAVALLVQPTCSLTISRFARDYNSDLTLAPNATNSLIRF